ncbi:hypothetical protein [Kitasatospora sp. NPDC056531]|uniref:hypothetical protein n=1 Tax=Kitasatospora sp. NPDC056531 TaxID=3345856 RepID=UPI00368C7CC7
MDLPGDDSAGLEDTRAIVSAVERHPSLTGPLVLVAQSLAGFSAPLVCGRLPVPVAEISAARTRAGRRGPALPSVPGHRGRAGQPAPPRSARRPGGPRSGGPTVG